MPTQEEIEKMSPEEIARLQKENCIFCKIIKGEIPSKKVYEDDTTVAILDINPARKGHVLVMPKEHYPILPLLPPETFKNVFEATKLISAGVKKAMLVSKTTIFLANGAIAGQQSPHFLFHVIPRDEGDGLNNFNLQPNPAMKSENDALFDSLKNNLSIMMTRFLEQVGKSPNQPPPPSTPDQPGVSGVPSSPEPLLDKREKIARILEENEEVRNLIMNDTEQFKQVIGTNKELNDLFTGVDLTALATNLKQLQSNADIQRQEKEFKEQQEKQKEPEQSEAKPENEPEAQPESSQPLGTPHPAGNVAQPTAPSNEASMAEEEVSASLGKLPQAAPSHTSPLAPKPEPEPEPEPSSLADYAKISATPAPAPQPKVFLGEDPLAQREKVFKYFEEKPRAKQLLVDNPQDFMNLLSQRPDVKPIFENVDVLLLAQKLKERESSGGGQ